MRRSTTFFLKPGERKRLKSKLAQKLKRKRCVDNRLMRTPRQRHEHQIDFKSQTGGTGRPSGGCYWFCRDERIGIPITSPATIISTRRLRCRPAAVSLEATGVVFPKPRALTAFIAIPCCTRKSLTVAARFSESC